MPKHNLLIVDDHAYFRKSIQLLLREHPLIDRVEEASTANEAVSVLEALPIHVVILDARLQEGDGLDVADYIRKNRLNVPIIAITSYRDAANILHLARAGVNAIMIKSSLDIKELETAIQKVISGKKYFIPEVKSMIDEHLHTIDLPAIRLTEAERKMLYFLNKGFTSKEISSHLNVTSNTVETNRKRLLERTQTHSVPELISYAYRNGLLF